MEALFTWTTTSVAVVHGGAAYGSVFRYPLTLNLRKQNVLFRNGTNYSTVHFRSRKWMSRLPLSPAARYCSTAPAGRSHWGVYTAALLGGLQTFSDSTLKISYVVQLGSQQLTLCHVMRTNGVPEATLRVGIKLCNWPVWYSFVSSYIWSNFLEFAHQCL